MYAIRSYYDPRKIDWLFPYYNMLLDDFTVKAEDIKNGSFDSFIENGPVLRTDRNNFV